MLPYLVTPALRQRLDLVRHLLAFGRQLVVVSGAPGSGRTRMLGQLAGEADGDADLDVITLHGPGCVSRAALLTRLHETLAATADAAAPEGAALVEAIRAEVRQRRARARQPVILLDDADALAEEAITALLELAHRGEELDELRVVLAAREEGALLTRLEQASGHAARVHVVSVPPLDPARLVELGEAWCEERDLPEQVLPAAELAAIAATCAGNPGRFVAALGARLDAGAGSGRRWPRLVVSPALQRAAGIGVVVLAALGLVALALHERDGGDTPAPPVSRTIELELPAAGAPAPPSAEAPTATEPTDGVPGSVRRPREAPLPVMDAAMDVTPAPTPDGAPTAPLDAPADATPDAASDGSPGAMSDAVTAVAAPAATPPADDGAPSPAAGAAEDGASAGLAPDAMSASGTTPAGARDTPRPRDASPTSAAAAPPPVSPPARADPEPATTRNPPATAQPTAEYTEKWVLTQDAERYVIQLFGSRSRAAAEEFRRRHGVGDGTTIVEQSHQGAPWYVLIHGLYPDRAAATRAIAALPAAQRSAGAWPRSVGSLRK